MFAHYAKARCLGIYGKTPSWIKSVFDFALSDKLINENPILLKDERLLKHVGSKFHQLESMADAGKLYTTFTQPLRNLVEYAASYEVATCVYLALHFAQRPTELTAAKWGEFDLDTAIWILPLVRSKTKTHMLKFHSNWLVNIRARLKRPAN